jgi:hypothetical protein
LSLLLDNEPGKWEIQRTRFDDWNLKRIDLKKKSPVFTKVIIAGQFRTGMNHNSD